MGERRASLIAAGAAHSDARDTSDDEAVGPTDLPPTPPEEDTFFPGDVGEQFGQH